MNWQTRIARWLQPARIVPENGTEPLSRVFGLDRGTPIDRRYIEAFLASHADGIYGDILEVGDDTYARRFCSAGGATIRVLQPLPATASASDPRLLFGNLEQPESLPEDAFDCFICTQTFNFVFDIAAAFRSSHRLLRPGGRLLATAAAICPISRYDMDRWGDYWRLTTASAARLLAPGFTEVSVAGCGNAFAATCFIQGLAVEDVVDPALLDEIDPDYPIIITMSGRKAP